MKVHNYMDERITHWRHIPKRPIAVVHHFNKMLLNKLILHTRTVKLII